MKNIFTVLMMSFILSNSDQALLSAQDPKRFEDEVKILKQKNHDFSSDRDVCLFVGSSSIRLWEDLELRFPTKNIINMGFGGSHMSDLFYYADELIFKSSFDKIFVYEGDNDISSGKSIADIMTTTNSLISEIRSRRPNAEVIVISAKPSLARWALKDMYIRLNSAFQNYCESHEKVSFMDIWTPMLDANGEVKTDLFVEDDLHMNSKGYDIWAKVLKKYL